MADPTADQDVEDDVEDDIDLEDLGLNLKTDELIRTFVDDKTEYESLVSQPVRTKPILTKYEKARMLGVRAQQISSGARPLVNIGKERDPIKIAQMEMDQKVLPILIRRFIPGRDPHKPTQEIVSPNQIISP